MPRTNFKLTPLEARKQLLLVESEVNRLQFTAEVAALRRDIHALAHQANSLVGTASSLFAGFQCVRDLWGSVHPNNGKSDAESGESAPSSWTSKISSAFRAGTELWNRFKNKSD